MAIEQADVERVLVIAEELRQAGRQDDAALLARLASESASQLRPAISADALDRRLEAAEADIAAGRVIPHEVVWEQVLPRRAADSRPEGNPR